MQSLYCKKNDKMKQSFLLVIISIILINIGFSQETHTFTETDKKALEKVIVEKYYVAQSKDVKDTVGGVLAKKSVTYRVYVDLLPGYKLQTVWGSEEQPLFFKTSTYFYNNINGATTGDDLFDTISSKKNNVLLDSWISMGAVTRFYNAVLLSEDVDGSIFNHKQALLQKDGLQYRDVYRTVYFNLDLTPLEKRTKSQIFATNNGAWANFMGAQGATPENRILIAQFTTNGEFSFECNIQVGTPAGEAIQFVARNPQGEQVQHQSLIFSSKHLK